MSSEASQRCFSVMMTNINNTSRMIDSKRFREIKTLQDIKLEKAKLRYEMLIAENRLIDSLGVVQGFFTASQLLSRANEMYAYVRRAYAGVQHVIGWVFRRKDRDPENEF